METRRAARRPSASACPAQQRSPPKGFKEAKCASRCRALEWLGQKARRPRPDSPAHPAVFKGESGEPDALPLLRPGPRRCRRGDHPGPGDHQGSGNRRTMWASNRLQRPVVTHDEVQLAERARRRPAPAQGRCHGQPWTCGGHRRPPLLVMRPPRPIPCSSPNGCSAGNLCGVKGAAAKCKTGDLGSAATAQQGGAGGHAHHERELTRWSRSRPKMGLPTGVWSFTVCALSVRHPRP